MGKFSRRGRSIRSNRNRSETLGIEGPRFSPDLRVGFALGSAARALLRDHSRARGGALASALKREASRSYFTQVSPLVHHLTPGVMQVLTVKHSIM
jgi:hypothetical protein